MKKKFKFLLFIGIIGALFYFGFFDKAKLETVKDLLSKGKDTAAQLLELRDLQGPYTVARIVDGDTIVVNIGLDSAKVRMIGVDTPESVSSNDAENCPEGALASEYTKNLLSDESVFLEYDKDLKDDYDRTLAYVYIKRDGKTTMVNRLLLENGMAETMTIEPNTKYAEDFKELENTAKINNVGFWAGNTFE